MNSELRIETLQVENVTPLAEFFGKENFGKDLAMDEFLNWQYRSNPFGKAVVSLAQETAGGIASQYALLPLELVNGMETIRGSLSLNTLTAQNFRGRGLFPATAEAAYRFCAEHEIKLTVGVPNKNSFSGFKNKLGFTHSGDLKFFLKPVSLIGMARGYFFSSNEKKGEEIGLVISSRSLRDNVSKLTLKEESERYSLFWNSWKRKRKIAVNRNVAYSDWRYQKAPFRKYFSLKHSADGKIKSVAILRAMHVFGLRTCLIMDLLGLEEASETSMLNSISNIAADNKLDAVIYACTSGSDQEAVLKSSGFFRIQTALLPQKLPFIIRNHLPFEGSESFLNLQNWHFTFGDYDIF